MITINYIKLIKNLFIFLRVITFFITLIFVSVTWMLSNNLIGIIVMIIMTLNFWDWLIIVYIKPNIH